MSPDGTMQAAGVRARPVPLGEVTRGWHGPCPRVRSQGGGIYNMGFLQLVSLHLNHHLHLFLPNKFACLKLASACRPFGPEGEIYPVWPAVWDWGGVRAPPSRVGRGEGPSDTSTPAPSSPHF